MSQNKYLVTTVSEFPALNAMCNVAFGYPNQYAQTYAEPIPHADGVQCLFVVEPRVVPLLTPEQVAALRDSIPGDWQYPAPPEPEPEPEPESEG